MSNLFKEPTSTAPIRALLAVALALALAMLLASPARAQATFTVTKTEDTNDSVCDADCSLREAVVVANDTPEADQITVPAGTYTLSIPEDSPGDATVGDLDITNDLTINGAGARSTIVQGGTNFNDRIFENGIATTTTITGLTITGGNASDGGGGIFNNFGDLTLREVAVDGNETSGNGGGISDGGSNLLIERSTISNNTASSPSSDGGGVSSAGGPVTIDNSTIAKNSADDGGGGYANTGNFETQNPLTVKNSTFVDNTADADGSGSGRGGGLANLTETTFKNTIVARNADTNADAGSENCGITDPATTVSQGFNLEDKNTCEFDQAASDQANVANPNLGPLADNDGPTDTVALLSGSPAIDKGEADVAADQRGVTRPQDGDSNGIPIDDIGAFEFEPPVNDPPVADGDSYSVDEDQTLTVSASSGVLQGDTDPDGDPLTVASPRPVSGPSNGTLDLKADGSFTYKPSKDFNGTDSFTYKATDGANESNSATVSITVRPMAEPDKGNKGKHCKKPKGPGDGGPCDQKGKNKGGDGKGGKGDGGPRKH